MLVYAENTPLPWYCAAHVLGVVVFPGPGLMSFPSPRPNDPSYWTSMSFDHFGRIQILKLILYWNILVHRFNKQYKMMAPKKKFLSNQRHFSKTSHTCRNRKVKKESVWQHHRQHRICACVLQTAEACRDFTPHASHCRAAPIIPCTAGRGSTLKWTLFSP